MVRVKYIESNGGEHVVDAEAGLSLMQGAVRNDIPGILADCGGSCACGTCRVYVDQAWRATVGDANDMEEAMLELHDDDSPGQRLACQIKLGPELDGLVVRLPARQF